MNESEIRMTPYKEGETLTNEEIFIDKVYDVCGKETWDITTPSRPTITLTPESPPSFTPKEPIKKLISNEEIKVKTISIKLPQKIKRDKINNSSKGAGVEIDPALPSRSSDNSLPSSTTTSSLYKKKKFRTHKKKHVIDILHSNKGNISAEGIYIYIYIYRERIRNIEGREYRDKI